MLQPDSFKYLITWQLLQLQKLGDMCFFWAETSEELLNLKIINFPRWNSRLHSPKVGFSIRIGLDLPSFYKPFVGPVQVLQPGCLTVLVNVQRFAPKPNTPTMPGESWQINCKSHHSTVFLNSFLAFLPPCGKHSDDANAMESRVGRLGAIGCLCWMDQICFYSLSWELKCCCSLYL